MIDSLDRANLFLVRLDDRGEWFRFHHLMTAAVRDMATDHASVRDVRTLHQRAAHWFESRAMLEDAARHAIAGHEWDRALRLLPTICGTLFREDRLAGMLKWLQDVPSSVLERDPMLCYWQAWALARLGKFGSAMEPLAIAERVWKDRDDAENLAAAQSLRVLQKTIQVEHRRSHRPCCTSKDRTEPGTEETHRDLDRDDRPPLRLGGGVVGLAEVHDRHAVRAERGADRRRRGGRAGRDLDLDDCGDPLLGHGERCFL